MGTSDWVFRNRFWLIAALFNGGFSASFLDPVNVVVAAVGWAGVDPASPAFDAWVRAGFGVGALLVILAAALRTWAAAYLTGEVVHDAALHDESLVSDGPYRFVRNPLYLGLLLLVLGFSPAASRTGFLFLVAGSVFLVRNLIAYEETRLAAARGAPFEAYRAAVPRLLPSLRPRIPSSGRPPRVAEAFLGESFFWVFAAGSVAFALTLNPAFFYGSCGAGLAVYALSFPLGRRLRARRAR